MNVKLSKYQNQDFNELVNIKETWHYDEFSSPKTAFKLAKVFLCSSLANYTFSQVALLKGKVVGIILTKDRKRSFSMFTCSDGWSIIGNKFNIFTQDFSITFCCSLHPDLMNYYLFGVQFEHMEIYKFLYY